MGNEIGIGPPLSSGPLESLTPESHDLIEILDFLHLKGSRGPVDPRPVNPVDPVDPMDSVDLLNCGPMDP